MPEVTIGSKIKQLRLKSKMTQKKLADLLDISPSAIGMYEQNRRIPDADSITKLASIFGVSTDCLLGHEKTAPKEQPLTEKQIDYLKILDNLTDNEKKQLIDYAELLERGRNQ